MILVYESTIVVKVQGTYDHASFIVLPGVHEAEPIMKHAGQMENIQERCLTEWDGALSNYGQIMSLPSPATLSRWCACVCKFLLTPLVQAY